MKVWSVKEDKPKLLKSQDVQVGAVLCLSVPADLPQVRSTSFKFLRCLIFAIPAFVQCGVHLYVLNTARKSFEV